MRAKAPLMACMAAALAALVSGTPGLAKAANALAWGSVVTRTANDCDAFSPVQARDGHSYTSYGDCRGLTGTLPKLSMGFGRLIGGPARLKVQDLPTNELRDVGNGPDGQKPSSSLVYGNRLYVWVRNYGPDGTQARLKYSDDFTRSGNSNWTWSSLELPQFGYPVFVLGKPSDTYAYIIAHDNNSAYIPADRFILMRVPLNRLATQPRPEYYNGTPGSPSWSGSYYARKAIFTALGKCFRSGITYNRFRGRYYWWQNNGASRVSNSFEVWSGANVWGPWTRVYYTSRWDVNPGERGEFPPQWLGREPISEPGTLYLVYSGDDRLNVRKATIAAGY